MDITRVPTDLFINLSNLVNQEEKKYIYIYEMKIMLVVNIFFNYSNKTTVK